MRRVSAICSGSEHPGPFLGKHFLFLTYNIVTFQAPAGNLISQNTKIDITDAKNVPQLAQYYEILNLSWESDSAAMAAFAVLLREAPFAAWEYHTLVLAVVRKMVQPKQAPTPGSTEANMQSYAAQRGNWIFCYLQFLQDSFKII